jgi:hypothetical protein
MKQQILLLSALLMTVALNLSAQPRPLKQVMELKMPKTAEDIDCGTRGASVCWEPVTKKYYAVFAGNKAYPLGVFDAAGKLLSDTAQTTLADVRGLWYNSITKKISGNSYNDGGWFSYILNTKGIPTDYKTDVAGMYQPDENSVGSFDPVSKSVFFLDKGKLSFYTASKNTPAKTVNIHWGRSKILGPAEDENADNENTDYNHTTAVYTGIKNAQVALLNVMEYRIELYDYREGYLQQVLTLPEDAPLQPSFNFAFANGMYWLFDIDNRKWTGYK